MKCPTVNCENTISPRSTRLYCATCRAAMGRWADRPPGDMREYRYRLQKYQDRLLNIRQRKETK